MMLVITAAVLSSALTITIIYIFFIRSLIKDKKSLMNTLEDKKVEAKKRIKDKEEPGRKEGDKDNLLMNGLVKKEIIVQKGRKVSNYTITDQLPALNSMDEIISFGLGISNQMEDPSIFNIAGYGPITRTDYLIAYRLVVLELMTRMKNIWAGTDEGADASKTDV